MNLQKALEIFGITSFASLNQDSLKKTYRKLAKQKHPDRQGGSNSEFVELREAYLFLYSELEKTAPVTTTNVTTFNSTETNLKELSKEEILSKYFHDTKDLQLKLDEYEDAMSDQARTLQAVKDEVEKIISHFEDRKKVLKTELEVEIAKLEKSYHPSILHRVFFFLPRMSEEEFWEKYHAKVQKYSRIDADTDVLFFKQMLSTYGQGLNEISRLISEV